MENKWCKDDPVNTKVDKAWYHKSEDGSFVVYVDKYFDGRYTYSVYRRSKRNVEHVALDGVNSLEEAKAKAIALARMG